jgi:hypothetical protein
LVVLGIAGVMLAGCESVGTAAQSKRNQGALLGGLLGAGTGAVIGNQTGNAGAGTAVGAALGALGGGLMGNAMDEQDGHAQHAHLPAAQDLTKFCPVGGELYASEIAYCPKHGVELRLKE